MAPVSRRLLICARPVESVVVYINELEERGAESGAKKVSKSDAPLSGCLDCSCVTFKTMHVTSSPL